MTLRQRIAFTLISLSALAAVLCDTFIWRP